MMAAVEARALFHQRLPRTMMAAYRAKILTHACCKYGELQTDIQLNFVNSKSVWCRALVKGWMTLNFDETTGTSKYNYKVLLYRVNLFLLGSR